MATYNLLGTGCVRRLALIQGFGMPYVITEPCIGVKDATCVEVCPVDCINTTEDDPQYFIDPVTCIDCSYCESVCPVNAIFDEFRVPGNMRHFIAINREFYKKR